MTNHDIDLANPTLTDGSAHIGRYEVQATNVLNGRLSYRVMDWDTGMVATDAGGTPVIRSHRRLAEEWVRDNSAE